MQARPRPQSTPQAQQQQQQQQHSQYLQAKAPHAFVDDHSPLSDDASPSSPLNVPHTPRDMSTMIADSVPPTTFFPDNELNDLNSFISEFASDFAPDSGVAVMYEDFGDDDMKIDTRPVAYTDYTNPASMVIYPNAVAPEPQYAPPVSARAAQPLMPTAEFVAGALTICEEPAQFGRFRYKSEKREKSLEGDKSFPEVMVNPAILKTITSGSIAVSLVTRTGQTHWHELGGVTRASVTARQCRYKFNNLTVLMDRAASGDVRRNKEDQRAVRLRFDLNFVANGKSFTCHTISRAIFNAKLQINKLSTTQGPITGHTEVIVLCSKVRKATTFIKIRDMVTQPSSSPPPAAPESSERPVIGIWDNLPDHPGGKSYMIPSNDLIFHHQYAIIFNMPPYYRQDATEQVHVEILLIDQEDQTESQACEFTYFPQESLARRDRADVKRRRLQGDADSFGSDGGRFGGSQADRSSGSGGAGAGNSFGFYTAPGGMGNAPSGYMAGLPAPVFNAFCMTNDLKYIFRAQAAMLRETDDEGESPLHLAIAGGQQSVASAIIDILGDDPLLNAFTDAGDCPLHLATWSKQSPLIQKLIRYGAKPEQTDRQGRTAYLLATEMGHVTTLDALVAYPEILSQPLPQHLAITDHRGLAPLHVATIRQDDTFVIKLLRLGANPLQRTRTDGRTALHLAVMQSNLSITKSLLQVAVKTNPDAANVRDAFDNTPLHLAAMSEQRVDIITLLRAYGADSRLLNSEFRTPVDLAASPSVQTALRAPRQAPKPEEEQLTVPPKAELTRKLSESDEWVIDGFESVPSQATLTQRDRQMGMSTFGNFAAVPASLLRSTSPSSSSSSKGEGKDKDKEKKGSSSNTVIQTLTKRLAKLDPRDTKEIAAKLEEASGNKATSTPKVPAVVVAPPPPLMSMD